MSFLDYLKLNSSITWRQTDIQNNVLVLEQGAANLSDSFTPGTGYNQINKVFFNTDILSSGELLQLDLFSLTRQIFGQNDTINFSGDNVKFIYIENTSTGLGYDLLIAGTGAGGFTQLLGYSYLGDIIKPGTYRTFYDNLSGFPINTGERYIYLMDINGNSGGISYELLVAGVDFD